MKNIMMKKRNTKSIIILSILLILFVTIPAVCANQTSDDTTDNQDIITNNIEKPNMQTNIKKDVEENSIYASTDAQTIGEEVAGEIYARSEFSASKIKSEFQFAFASYKKIIPTFENKATLYNLKINSEAGEFGTVKTPILSAQAKTYDEFLRAK